MAFPTKTAAAAKKGAKGAKPKGNPFAKGGAMNKGKSATSKKG
jgi:hypothetical protein